MTLMTAEQVLEAHTRYEAADFDTRIGGELDHLLPKPQTDRRCSECTRKLPVIVFGWTEVEWAAKHNKGIDALPLTGICEKCADGDSDEEDND